MKLKIEIDMDNAAFEEFPVGEVEAILRKAVSLLYFDGSKEVVVLRDRNGNTVGKATVTGKKT